MQSQHIAEVQKAHNTDCFDPLCTLLVFCTFTMLYLVYLGIRDTQGTANTVLNSKVVLFLRFISMY